VKLVKVIAILNLLNLYRSNKRINKVRLYIGLIL